MTVVLPELVPRHWWENLLHNQTALFFKRILLFEPGVVVTSVPFHLSAPEVGADTDLTSPENHAPGDSPQRRLADAWPGPTLLPPPASSTCRARPGVLERALEHTLLPKVLALPVFAFDALVGRIRNRRDPDRVVPRVVRSAGLRHAHRGGDLALMAVVVVSYRQTVRAYPSGGGAYIVSKDNLGAFAVWSRPPRCCSTT